MGMWTYDEPLLDDLLDAIHPCGVDEKHNGHISLGAGYILSI
jgi:hypothetical protein